METSTSSPVASATTSYTLPGIFPLIKQAIQKLKVSWKTFALLELVAWTPALIGWIILAFVHPVPGTPPTGNEAALLSLTKLFGVVAGVLRIAIFIAEMQVAGSETMLTFQEAWKWGWKRWLPFAGRGLLLSILGTAVFLPLLSFVVGSFLLGAGIFVGVPVQGLGKLLFVLGLLALCALPFLLFVRIRFVFVLPLVALQESDKPFSDSWNLTAHRFWPIFWRLIGAGILAVIVMGIFSALVVGVFTFLSGILFHDIRAEASPAIQFLGSLVTGGGRAVFFVLSAVYLITLLRHVQKMGMSGNTARKGIQYTVFTAIVLALCAIIASTVFGIQAKQRVSSFMEHPTFSPAAIQLFQNMMQARISP